MILKKSRVESKSEHWANFFGFLASSIWIITVLNKTTLPQITYNFLRNFVTILMINVTALFICTFLRNYYFSTLVKNSNCKQYNWRNLNIKRLASVQYWCHHPANSIIPVLYTLTFIIYSFGQWLLWVHINVHDRRHYYLVLSIFIIKVVSA